MEFELSMSKKELKKRTSKGCYKGIKFLSLEDGIVKKLNKNDLLVLCHLTRAASYFDIINLKLEHPLNMEFLQFLNKNIEQGNESCVLAKKMFLSQKSMFSPDSLGNQTVLVKNVVNYEGKNYFPPELTIEQFHNIIDKMLEDGEVEEVKRILNQRTIVRFNGSKLKAIDFIDAFDEFKLIANELECAKKYCWDKNFNKYLDFQIQALRTADENLDAKADIAWAKLDECKFEFTITRESYEENFSKSIFENKELFEKLCKFGIQVFAKDSLGARVGIVNKTGTKLLKKLRLLVGIASDNMPYKNEYKSNYYKNDNLQTAVDVDLITLTGDEGSYQASIVLAQNLPNDDKLALKLGGGRRNVYHRQIRKKYNKKLYKELICEDQFRFFYPEADHWAVICHENTHSLGPESHSSLGKYSAIIEEFKADMGMYAFLDEFVEAGEFSENQINQIMVTSLSKGFCKGKPSFSQAHRVRSVMICNRLLSDGGIIFTKEKKLRFDFQKIKNSTKNMLSEVVRLQIDKNINGAREYIDKWFNWTNDLQEIADIIKKHSKMLNGYLITPLADAFLNSKFEEII